MTVTKIGTRMPEDYDQDAASAYAVNDGDMFATVTACADGVGFIIETWHIDVGLTTFWRATTLAESVAFSTSVVESEEDYALASDAQHAANPHRFEGEL